MTPAIDFATLRRHIRRHRRGLSAAAAFLAVVFLGMSLRPAESTGPDAAPSVPAGYVEMPVVLANGAIASALAPGDVVDVIAQGPVASVVAEDALVMTAAAAGGFTSSGSAVVLALPRAAGLAIARVEAPLTVLRHAG